MGKKTYSAPDFRGSRAATEPHGLVAGASMEWSSAAHLAGARRQREGQGLGTKGTLRPHPQPPTSSTSAPLPVSTPPNSPADHKWINPSTRSELS